MEHCGVQRYARFVALLALVSSPALAQDGPPSNVAAGATSVNSEIPRCSRTVGDIAIGTGENADWHQAFVRGTNMNSIVPLLRNYVLQSNCFRITTQASRSERAISGISQQGQGGDFR